MSTYQAVATVTAALRQRLLETVPTDVPGATVTTLRPAEPGTGGLPLVGVNLFLFSVHVSGAHRNRDLPLRTSAGDLRQVPVIPLELDYLVSFYGDDNGAAHQLAGSVMRSLYARPILTADMIAAGEDAAPGLASRLADQADRVRFTPLPLPIEEISKLWSVFFQISYALSVVFRAGPVMIEADVPASVGPPVLTPQLAVFGLASPVVTAVVASGQTAAALITPALITPGSAIDVLGQGFDAAGSTILLNGMAVTPSAATTTKLTATLPPGLAAGPVGLQVRQSIPVGSPASLRAGPVSDLAAFVLHPVVTQSGGHDDIAVTGETGTGAAARSATVSVGLDPPVGATQTAALELLDLTGALQFAFAEGSRSVAAGTIAIAVTGVAPGTYVLRCRVDGAETPVVTDTTAGSPTAGQLVPQVAFA